MKKAVIKTWCFQFQVALSTVRKYFRKRCQRFITLFIPKLFLVIVKINKPKIPKISCKSGIIYILMGPNAYFNVDTFFDSNSHKNRTSSIITNYTFEHNPKM
jgi:hypothetical protein